MCQIDYFSQKKLKFQMTNSGQNEKIDVSKSFIFRIYNMLYLRAASKSIHRLRSFSTFSSISCNIFNSMCRMTLIFYWRIALTLKNVFHIQNMFLNSFPTILRPFEAKVLDEKCQKVTFGQTQKWVLGHFFKFIFNFCFKWP